MKFSLSWLKEYLETNADINLIVDTLNKVGLEVEGVINKADELKSFDSVIIEECINHPDSDHLHICKVGVVGKNEKLTIVCGAPNVRVGLKTILAPIGSRLPDGTELKKTKIRGIESNGMLCSMKELGLGEEHDGIIELDDNTELGVNVANIFDLNNPIIDISITPNRGDCLGIYGIARDLAAAGLGRLKSIDDFDLKINDSIESSIKLNVEDNNCPIFKFREIKNIKNQESPEWLKKRLKSIDINPKNALVDISNYVMFAFNKPLHCYDSDKIKGNLNVKSSLGCEEFIDLFDQKYILNDSASLIRDDEKILCLGGIIGSKDSCSDNKTSNVLVESAIFDSINTARSGRLLNIQTDARYRFERGSDYEIVDFALDYTCKLIQEICGGQISKKVEYEKKNFKTKRVINLEFDYIKKLLGINIEKSVIFKIFNKLDYTIKENNEVLEITVAPYKNNILVKEDIIEDVIRLYSYDKLIDGDFIDTNIFEKNENLYNKSLQNKLYQIRQNLVSNCFVELISYTFLNKKENNYFVENNDDLDLINPIISDLSHMRQNLLPNILNAIKRNNNRGFDSLSFFEIGKVFQDYKPNKECTMIAGIRSGKNKEKDIYENPRNYDVFDIKKDIFDSLSIFGINGNKISISKSVPKYYHPNRSGALLMGQTLIGYFGELHPSLLKEFDLKQRSVLFELFIDNLPKKVIVETTTRSSFKPNDFQSIDRDFAFIIDKNVEVGSIIKDVENINRDFISNVRLFDIYTDEKMQNKKSIAFNVKIQPKDKNLNKDEIDAICDNIINHVTKNFDGILRDR